MTRVMMAGVGGIAVAAAMLSGCSSDKSSDAGAGSDAPRPQPGIVAGSTANPRIVVDGKHYDVEGTVKCIPADGTLGIGTFIPADGQNLSRQELGTYITTTGAPTVVSLSLRLAGEPKLMYIQNWPGLEASVTKTGDTYAISGKITEESLMNGGPSPVPTKTFEIEVTCP